MAFTIDEDAIAAMVAQLRGVGHAPGRLPSVADSGSAHADSAAEHLAEWARVWWRAASDSQSLIATGLQGATRELVRADEVVASAAEKAVGP